MADQVSMQIAVPNGLLFARDAKTRKYPEIDDERASFWFIPTCVMIQCLVDSEGPTSITIGTAEQVAERQQPAFDQILETPSRKIVFEIVPGETIHQVSTPTDRTRVRIWTDGRHQCAQTVIIGL